MRIMAQSDCQIFLLLLFKLNLHISSACPFLHEFNFVSKLRLWPVYGRGRGYKEDVAKLSKKH